MLLVYCFRFQQFCSCQSLWTSTTWKTQQSSNSWFMGSNSWRSAIQTSQERQVCIWLVKFYATQRTLLCTCCWCWQCKQCVLPCKSNCSKCCFTRFVQVSSLYYHWTKVARSLGGDCGLVIMMMIMKMMISDKDDVDPHYQLISKCQ